jgi:hypothetical protein
MLDLTPDDKAQDAFEPEMDASKNVLFYVVVLAPGVLANDFLADGIIIDIGIGFVLAGFLPYCVMPERFFHPTRQAGRSCKSD